jgi:hypothetical protein
MGPILMRWVFDCTLFRLLQFQLHCQGSLRGRGIRIRRQSRRCCCGWFFSEFTGFTYQHLYNPWNHIDLWHLLTILNHFNINCVGTSMQSCPFHEQRSYLTVCLFVILLIAVWADRLSNKWHTLTDWYLAPRAESSKRKNLKPDLGNKITFAK